MKMSASVSARAIAMSLTSILLACEGNVPVCNPGEAKVEGSLDEELLTYEPSCNPTRAGDERCLGQLVEVCDGVTWQVLQSCQISGQTCRLVDGPPRRAECFGGGATCVTGSRCNGTIIEDCVGTTWVPRLDCLATDQVCVVYTALTDAPACAPPSSCDPLCWSYAIDGACAATCPVIEFDDANGIIVDERRLMLVEPEDANSRRGRIYSFGYVDELGGRAPNGWGFLSEGRRSYLGNTLDGSARFVIQMVLTEMDTETLDQRFTQVYTSEPGRLEILEATGTRIAGRFFVGFNSPTDQPGGELLGCFNFRVNETIDNLYRLLTTH